MLILCREGGEISNPVMSAVHRGYEGISKNGLPKYEEVGQEVGNSCMVTVLVRI